MSTYANVLIIAIPIFFFLVLLEILYGLISKKYYYNLMDTLSSLSSGITNLLKDLLGIGIIIISYPFIKKSISIVELNESLHLYVIAFLCLDFASYWNHRLNHTINFFWNQHVIHHSSQEFNLACALRQSISNLLGYGAIFLIPAAFFGVPHNVISFLAPLHLFGQFWYHTKHVGKLGFLEYIFVTPSQHRVHHAINKEYIDKNLSAIFCIWDRLFGTFQEELENVPCVYGTLKPVNTWNPFIINFQHLWYLIIDAWHTRRLINKIKIWFMPTGWRPNDVKDKFKRDQIIDVYNQKKYKIEYKNIHIFYAIYHFIYVNATLWFLLNGYDELGNNLKMYYSMFILTTIFGFTSIMDNYKWASYIEFSRLVLGIVLINNIIEFENFNFYLYNFYFMFSIFLTLTISSYLPNENKIV
jgi:sterol desaturase/sphingolipid hydroxylase (fatty acid hydroxylase superfamily)